LINQRFTNMFGCDKSSYMKGRAFKDPDTGDWTRDVHKRDKANCNHPDALGWLAAAYFISLVVLGSQVTLALALAL